MNKTYKFDWVNAGKEFEAPKINVEIDLTILDFMSKQPENMKDVQKNVLEFVETIYQVLVRVDKNVTRDIIKQQLDMRELGQLVFAFRTNTSMISVCPHCNTELSYNDIFGAPTKDFQNTQSKKDITVTKKET